MNKCVLNLFRMIDSKNKNMIGRRIIDFGALQNPLFSVF